MYSAFRFVLAKSAINYVYFILILNYLAYPVELTPKLTSIK